MCWQQDRFAAVSRSSRREAAACLSCCIDYYDITKRKGKVIFWMGIQGNLSCAEDSPGCQPGFPDCPWKSFSYKEVEIKRNIP
jgi:hypothetical protein